MLLFALTALAADPVAVVELFTSQGCSSCPAADAILAGIAAEARKDGHPVYVLSFHVDYWDKLGWKDPYGDARWTGRQRDYALSLDTGGRLYTPMVVVNGTQHVVGSKEPLVKGLIAGALTTDATATVSGNVRFDDGDAKIEVTTLNAPIGAQVFVAVVEPERHNAVKAGENKGRDLVHANVVRAMAKVDASGQRGRIPVPADVDTAKAELFAWIQDPLTNQVVGAGRLERRE